MAKVKKGDTATIKYLGDQGSIDYAGFHLPRGEVVTVDKATAILLADNDYFDVAGLTADDTSDDTTSTEDALAAERTASSTALASAQADAVKQLSDQADKYQAQIDDLNKQITDLKTQLAAAQKASVDVAQTVTATATDSTAATTKKAS